MTLRHVVILVSLNRKESLLRLLDSLISTRRNLELVVSIVESSLDSGYHKLLEKTISKNFHSDSFFIYDPRGITSCRNVALEQLRKRNVFCDLVHFLDDDVTIERDYFENIESFFISNPKCVAGGPRIKGLYTGELQSRDISSKFISSLGIFPSGNFGKITSSGRNFWIPDEVNQLPIRVEWIPGCSMIFRASAIVNEKFNENIELGPLGNYALGEDVDFSFRISKKGKMSSIPSTCITHHYEPGPRYFKIVNLRAYGAWKAYLCRNVPQVKVSHVLLTHYFEYTLGFDFFHNLVSHKSKNQNYMSYIISKSAFLIKFPFHFLRRHYLFFVFLKHFVMESFQKVQDWERA